MPTDDINSDVLEDGSTPADTFDDMFDPEGEGSDGTPPEPEEGTEPAGEPVAEPPGEPTPPTPSTPAPPAAAPAPPPIPPVPVPAEAEAPAEAPGEAPVGAPEVPEVPAAPEMAPEPQAPAPPTREQLLELRGSLQQQIEQRYTNGMSQEERDSFTADPAAALPKFAAKLYLDIYDAVFSNVMAQVPPIVQTLARQAQRGAEEQRSFYDTWPQLRGKKYEPVVRRIAATYRQLFPNTGPEQFIQEVGTQAMTVLGLQAPAAPAAAPAPYAPAAPGGAAPRRVRPSGQLPFAGLVKETESLDI